MGCLRNSVRGPSEKAQDDLFRHREIQAWDSKPLPARRGKALGKMPNLEGRRCRKFARPGQTHPVDDRRILAGTQRRPARITGAAAACFRGNGALSFPNANGRVDERERRRTDADPFPASLVGCAALHIGIEPMGVRVRPATPTSTLAQP